ncbi:MAG TPA: hypothetical protein VHQ90_10895 [Thermoanaerobaculia bacterium]|nr:hypothetical protein [Thermoanaerobaculia bacterium]
MVKMLGTGETLIHVAGFQNFGLRGQPATLITLTSKRLIIQLYPGEKPIKLPLKEIAEVSCHRDYLFQNNLHITGTSGLVCKLAMEKDIAAPLERAIKAAQRA